MPETRMYYIEWDNTFHETLFDVHEHLVHRDHPEAVVVYECDRVYFEAPSAKSVAEDLMGDFCLRLEGVSSFCRNWVTAEWIADLCLEEFYDGVDDVSDVPDCEGVEKLQLAIDEFYFWNRPLFWLLWRFAPRRWCGPGRWAIGLGNLRCALKEFESVNRDRYILFRPNWRKNLNYVVLASTEPSEVGDE